MAHFRKTMSATTLLNDKVVNKRGDNLGKIDEIMLDVVSGKIAYLVLSFGGILGLGDKLFAIPFEKFEVDEDHKQFVLDVEQSSLEDAPGFDKNNWPDFGDMKWNEEIFTFYNSTPYWEETL